MCVCVAPRVWCGVVWLGVVRQSYEEAWAEERARSAQAAALDGEDGELDASDDEEEEDDDEAPAATTTRKVERGGRAEATGTAEAKASEPSDGMSTVAAAKSGDDTADADTGTTAGVGEEKGSGQVWRTSILREPPPRPPPDPYDEAIRDAQRHAVKVHVPSSHIHCI